MHTSIETRPTTRLQITRPQPNDLIEALVSDRLSDLRQPQNPTRDYDERDAGPTTCKIMTVAAFLDFYETVPQDKGFFFEILREGQMIRLYIEHMIQRIHIKSVDSVEPVEFIYEKPDYLSGF